MTESTAPTTLPIRHQRSAELLKPLSSLHFLTRLPN